MSHDALMESTEIPVPLCDMPGKGREADTEALSFIRIARKKAPFPAGGYIRQAPHDGTVALRAVYDPNVTGARSWAEYVRDKTPEILEEVRNCEHLRRPL